MSSSKDWVNLDSDDLHTTSSEEDEHSQQDFSVLNDGDGSSSADAKSHSTEDEQEETVNPATESPFSRLIVKTNDMKDRLQRSSIPALETAFAKLRQTKSSQSSEPELPPINFDAEDDSEISNAEGMEQERWQKTDAYMRDMQEASRQRPAVRVLGNDRYMKVLLIGEHGLGKEAFIKNVFASYCSDDDLPVTTCDVDTSLHSFRDSPSDFCTKVVIDVDNGRTRIHYLMQDTPGTHVQGCENVVVEHVRKQIADYMAMEQDSRRTVPLSSLPDPRIDIALYFLSPFFVKPQDIATIAKLSAFVPVVPVIAKADALTTAELSAHRQEVKQQLKAASEKAGRQVMHTFSANELKEAKAVREVPPFAVITSSEVEPEVGRHWFTRTFPWGKCEVMSSNHSDLPALKSLLFEHCFESIKAATEARFYTARENFLTTRALSTALSSKELPSPSPRSNAMASTVNAVNTPLASNKAKKASPAKESSGWKWTLGIVTIAVLVQLVAMGYYSRNLHSLKSMVDTYQAESLAEKQEIQELLRERLLAIEHKPGWTSSTNSAVKSFFSSMWMPDKAAKDKWYQRSYGKLTGQMNRMGNGIRDTAVFVGNDLAKDWKAMTKFSKQAVCKTGSSMKLGARNAAGELANSFRIANRRTAQYLASMTRRASTATLGKLSSFKRACSKSAKDSLTRTGGAIQAGANNVYRGTIYGMKATSHNIALGASEGKRAFSKQVGRCFTSFKQGVAKSATSLSQKTAQLGRAAGHKVQKAGHSTGDALKRGAKGTGTGLKSAANSSFSYAKGVWASEPTAQHVLYWFVKRRGGFIRVFRRTLAAAFVQ